MPLFEWFVVTPELGHHRQNSAGTQELVQTNEFLFRMTKVFDCFGGRNKVVCFRKYDRVWRKKWIVDLHGKTAFFEHEGQGWSGAATKIEPSGAGNEVSDQRKRQTIEKCPISIIQRIVFVGQIMGAFGVGGESLVGVQKDERARGAFEISALMGFGKDASHGGLAQRTIQ